MSKLLTEDERKEIKDTILSKCPEYKCFACVCNKLKLFDHIEIGKPLDFWEIVTSLFSTVPYITIVCDNCGFMGKHAIGALGLMHLYKDPFEKKSEVEESK